MDSAVARALASHQCGPGSNLGPDVVCGLSLLLVLILAPRVFRRVLRFSSFHKNQHFSIPICKMNGREEPLCWLPIHLFILFYSYATLRSRREREKTSGTQGERHARNSAKQVGSSRPWVPPVRLILKDKFEARRCLSFISHLPRPYVPPQRKLFDSFICN